MQKSKKQNKKKLFQVEQPRETQQNIYEVSVDGHTDRDGGKVSDKNWSTSEEARQNHTLRQRFPRLLGIQGRRTSGVGSSEWVVPRETGRITSGTKLIPSVTDTWVTLTSTPFIDMWVTYEGEWSIKDLGLSIRTPTEVWPLLPESTLSGPVVWPDTGNFGWFRREWTPVI